MTKYWLYRFKFEPQDGTIPTKKEARRLLAMFNKLYPNVKEWQVYFDGKISTLSDASRRAETKTKRKTNKAKKT